MNKFKFGDKVWYRGNWNKGNLMKGKIVGIGERDERVVYDFGRHGDMECYYWGYESQFEERKD